MNPYRQYQCIQVAIVIVLDKARFCDKDHKDCQIDARQGMFQCCKNPYVFVNSKGQPQRPFNLVR